MQEGTYVFLTGPSYETPAEIKACRILGADAVGMSTVPEVVAANHCGMKTAGISCITNMAAGILDQPLNHREVMETADRVKDSFSRIIKSVVENI
jgi:purine-nucleoside phosphorylase